MIKTEIKNLSTCRKELQIVMAKAALEPIREKEINKVRKTVQFPGFRKGKATVAMIMRSYAQQIEVYTMESAVQSALEEAVKENNLYVVGMPDPKKVDFSEDGDLEMTIEIETYPEVELKAYKDFEFVKDKYVIEDSFIDAQVEQLRKKQAVRTEVETTVADGHIVSIDMEELDETGKPIKGKKYTDISVVVGEGRFDPELEKQLIGLAKGSANKIEKTYPDDFPQKEMAGKVERYNITVNKIETEELPVLDDAFAERVNPTFKTMDELKVSLKEHVRADYEKEADSRLNQDITQKLIEENPFELPQALVENYLDNIVKDARQRDKAANESELREYYQNDAVTNMKWYYIQDKIASEEKIVVEDSDVDEFLENIKSEEVQKIYKENADLLDKLKDDIRSRKVQESLAEHNKISDNEIILN